MDNIQNIKAISDGREEITSRVEYSKDEIDEINDLHMQNAKQIKKLADEVKEINKQKKTISDENLKLVIKSELGFEDTTVDAYYVNDYDNGVRNYFDEYGTFIKERRLEPKERKQPTLYRNAINQ